MHGQDDARLRDILDQAAQLRRADRGAYLDEACRDDATLRAELESLLKSLDSAEGFLGEPTIGPDAVHVAEPRASAAAPDGGQAPERVGQYKLLQLIGEGGFGSVYRAEQQHPVRRTVALKIIKPGMDSKQVIARFEAERQALALMDHPNIAKVLDAGTTPDGRPYFAMELVEGVAITEFCDANRLTTRQRLDLMISVCAAVQHAHQKGIIHRDLKPGNVLVAIQDERPMPRVIDFGIAKAVDQQLTGDPLVTDVRHFVGTPVYMSPEQARMNGQDVDTRSDIYSLGVLLYQLLTGTTPFCPKHFREADYDEVRRVIREVDPPRPSTRLGTLGDELRTIAMSMRVEPARLCRTVSGDLDCIVMKCLEKDRDRRYPTALGLMADLRRYLDGAAVEASPPTIVYRVRKLVGKHRLAVGVSALLLAASGFSTWQAVHATHAARLALEQKQRADQQAEVARRQQEEADHQRNRAESNRAMLSLETVEARKQQRIAQAANAFLSNVLSSADPERLLGDKLTVVQVLTMAEKELDGGSRAMDPAAEAELRGTIGRTLQSLGRPKQAEPNLRKAVEILRKLSPGGSIELATAVEDLGSLLAELNELEEAENLLREAPPLYRKVLPAGHVWIASALANFGQLLVQKGKFHEAEAVYREALGIARRAEPRDDSRLRDSLSNLGLLLVDLSELDESERLLREALAIDRKIHVAAHPDIATDLNNLAYLLVRRDAVKEAESMYREALAINRKLYPGGHPALARTLCDLALLLAASRPEEAEAMYREALEINRRILPAPHPDVARNLNGLATLLGHQGRTNEAEPMYREAIDIDRRSLPADHPDVATHRDNFTVFLLRQRRLADAEKLQRNALEYDQKALPPGHRQIATDLSNVAILLARQKKPQEAEKMYREAIQIDRNTPSRNSADLAIHLNNLAFLLAGQNRLDEAEALFRQLLDVDGASHASQATVGIHLKALASILEREGKPAQAEQTLRDSRSPGAPATQPAVDQGNRANAG